MRKFLLFAAFAALLSLPAAADAASIPYPGNGKGGPAVSTSQAISEQEKLASAGNTDAQYKLGELLFQNYSVISAKKWLEKAAASGNLLAEARLFYIDSCLSGKVDKNKKFNKLTELFKLESDDAMLLLGDFYLAGCGVAKDRRRAIAYFTSAAQSGDPHAQLSLALEEAEALERAFEKIEKIAEQGYAPAQTILGFYYQKGKGTQKDPQKAFIWYHKAAEQGHVIAQANLGFCYQDGTGTPKDPRKAFLWFQKAAAQGDTTAQVGLGIYYENGIGIPKDPQQAFTWYQKAAEQGDANAQSSLGLCYENGIGVPKDPQKAVFWYQKAAEQGDEFAQKKLQELK